ncbi:MAG: acetate--CoA ligase family protein [Candidatus Melainabacteria bacterium]|nr:acetate--CoA ligase family protein [Candidatus Melainabacteria bacterium]MBI3308257.1 acetate--CoA ligase family protein [Candidatus Melainabacteria bacterium]
MKLFEYEAKTIMGNVGIPVPSGKIIKIAEEVFNLKLNYPVVIKCQVQTGGRGKAGGVKFANNLLEAYEIAKNLLQLKIKDCKTYRLLIEPKTEIEQELYVAITLDRTRKCHILLGSSEGGIEIESSAEVKIIPVEGEYKPYLGRRLASNMGLTGTKLNLVSDVINKLYYLYESHDLELAEINPLVFTKDGNIVALDGKMTVNDDAIDRQPFFEGWEVNHLTDVSERELRAKIAGLNLVELSGKIGIICNGAGLTMATMDIVKNYGGEPANFLDVGGGADKSKVIRALKLVADNPSVKVILVNILGGITACDEVAKALKEFAIENSDRKVVVRLLGNNQEKGLEIMKGTGIKSIDDLNEAVKEAVALGAKV